MAMFGALGRALSNPDTLAAIGATLGDVGASLNGERGGNVLALQKLLADKREKAAADAWMRRAPAGLFGGQAAAGGITPAGTGVNPAGGSGADTLDPFGAGLGAAVDLATPEPAAPAPARAAVPSLADALPWIMEGVQRGDPRATQYLSVLKAAQPDAPAHIEGNDGIYERQPDNSWKRVVEYPAQNRISPGWEADPATPGAWRPVKNGPYDPDYIRRTAGERREAVTSRPMPRTGGGGRGGASIPPPPTGWRPIAR